MTAHNKFHLMSFYGPLGSNAQPKRNHQTKCRHPFGQGNTSYPAILTNPLTGAIDERVDWMKQDDFQRYHPP